MTKPISLLGGYIAIKISDLNLFETEVWGERQLFPIFVRTELCNEKRKEVIETFISIYSKAVQKFNPFNCPENFIIMHFKVYLSNIFVLKTVLLSCDSCTIQFTHLKYMAFVFAFLYIHRVEQSLPQTNFRTFYLV